MYFLVNLGWIIKVVLWEKKLELMFGIKKGGFLFFNIVFIVINIKGLDNWLL